MRPIELRPAAFYKVIAKPFWRYYQGFGRIQLYRLPRKFCDQNSAFDQEKIIKRFVDARMVIAVGMARVSDNIHSQFSPRIKPGIFWH